MRHASQIDDTPLPPLSRTDRALLFIAWVAVAIVAAIIVSPLIYI